MKSDLEQVFELREDPLTSRPKYHSSNNQECFVSEHKSERRVNIAGFCTVITLIYLPYLQGFF